MDTLNTRFFKLKEFRNFIIVKQLMQFCFSKFCFEETRVVNFVSDQELSSSLYYYLLNCYYVYEFYTVANYRDLLFNVKASFN